MRLLASAHDKRWDIEPDVPTIQEVGYDVVCKSYMGLCVPADTPDEIVEFLRDALDRAWEDEAFQEILANTNTIAGYLSGEEYEALCYQMYKENGEALGNG